MITQDQVRAVLEGLGEDFIVDIPANHDGKGGYTLDYFKVVEWLIWPPQEWIDRLVGYVNAKALLTD